MNFRFTDYFLKKNYPFSFGKQKNDLWFLVQKKLPFITLKCELSKLFNIYVSIKCNGNFE